MSNRDKTNDSQRFPSRHEHEQAEGQMWRGTRGSTSTTTFKDQDQNQSGNNYNPKEKGLFFPNPKKQDAQVTPVQVFGFDDILGKNQTQFSEEKDEILPLFEESEVGTGVGVHGVNWEGVVSKGEKCRKKQFQNKTNVIYLQEQQQQQQQQQLQSQKLLSQKLQQRQYLGQLVRNSIIQAKEFFEQREINICRILFWIFSILASSQLIISLILFSQYISAPLQKISVQRTMVEFQESYSRTKARKQLKGESRLIPHLLHQIQQNQYVSGISPELARSWVKCGKFTNIGFYSKKDIQNFVHREYPEYGFSFSQLKNQQEREIIFKFLVIYRYGGIYADPETECIGKIDTIIGSTDSMVVGWDMEAASELQAIKKGLFKKKQLVGHIFAASHGHPVLKEVVESLLEKSDARISPEIFYQTQNENQNYYLQSQNLDLQRESITLFTDIVMRHVTQHPPNVTSDPWTVTVLPSIAFSTNFSTTQSGKNKQTSVPGVIVALKRKQKSKFSLNFNNSIKKNNLHINSKHPPLVDNESEYTHYPVTILQDPPFTQMTNLIRQGDNQSNFDVNQQIATYGNFQWGIPYYSRPTLLQVLLGSLGNLSANTTTFVDIGAGIGFTSLGAAARGHPVVAFEASRTSLETFQHSVEYNGFQPLVNIIEKPVRSAKNNQPVCIQRKGEFQYLDRSDYDLVHGYGDPYTHALDSSKCLKFVESVRVDEILSVDDENLFIGAIKITVNGWEAHVLESMEQLLRQKPPKSVFITFGHGLLVAAGYPDPKQILNYMHALGYQKIAYSGLNCTVNMDSKSQENSQLVNDQQQQFQKEQEQKNFLEESSSTWCWLQQDRFDEFVERTKVRSTEIFNLLFILGDSVDQGAGQVQEKM